MGMEIGGKTKGLVSEPNIVPLIDVLLVLIIIFMVITPRIPTGLPTLVPQAAPAGTPETPQPNLIVVQVLQGGKVMINQDPVDWDTLGARLSVIFEQRPDKVAFVKGGAEVPFAEMARAIDIMRGVGISGVGLMTDNSGA
jgi:biopolymer transport protein TolR